MSKMIEDRKTSESLAKNHSSVSTCIEVEVFNADELAAL